MFRRPAGGRKLALCAIAAPPLPSQHAASSSSPNPTQTIALERVVSHPFSLLLPLCSIAWPSPSRRWQLGTQSLLSPQLAILVDLGDGLQTGPSISPSLFPLRFDRCGLRLARYGPPLPGPLCRKRAIRIPIPRTPARRCRLLHHELHRALQPVSPDPTPFSKP